ncbi:hypothetical protein CYLTODRAFT_494738 [Cylindrobasidium torrendii FP15055 ss-10]|nr:hypothetical protein CYLTODRAFT_494738 [Cylindrobasidium torrendii FP15055 ss-10]
MDSNKTGETLDGNVLKKHLAADHVQWKYVPWDLRDKKKDKSGGYTVNDKKYAVRSKDMPPFIMDVINSATKKAGKEAQKQFDKVLGDADRDDLPAFEAPLKLLRQSVTSKESRVSADKDRDMLMAHVAEVYLEYTSTIGSSATYQERISHARKRFWAFDSSKLGFVRKNEVSPLLASLAAAKNKDFAFQVAFRELCLLQAMAATGGWKPVVRGFYERFRLKVERVQASPE